VNLDIFDIMGRKIQRIVNEEQASGFYRINLSTNNIPSGIYFARLQAGRDSKTIKVTVMK
ncbi:MAG: T9SS type A sorting domain-containing protein, partial [candidate division Zixibacteria bacterium]|nr:T9SS type A sorting domain-containing protein [candidate division Zixibacteria bacterium]